jgi:hypothetical protein
MSTDILTPQPIDAALYELADTSPRRRPIVIFATAKAAHNLILTTHVRSFPILPGAVSPAEDPATLYNPSFLPSLWVLLPQL